jgi:hypothetical protein
MADANRRFLKAAFLPMSAGANKGCSRRDRPGKISDRIVEAKEKVNFGHAGRRVDGFLHPRTNGKERFRLVIS